MSIADTTFTCYYGGKWKKTDGELTYDGGEILTLDGQPHELFTMLTNNSSVSLYGKKIWFKLPFEDLNERKELCSSGVNFKKMCDAAIWTKAVDVFMVNDGFDCVADACDRNGASNHESRDDQFAEEARVESVVATFVDEELEDDYIRTPVSSDCEEEEYVRCRKGSGELRLRQVFYSLEKFKEALVDYVLKEGWNVKISRWGKDKSEAKCGKGGGCPWRIYCSYEEPAGKWMVKTYNDTHSCTKNGYSKILKQDVIAKLFINDVRSDPQLKPKCIQDQIQQRWNLVATIDKCKKAKRRALEIIQEEHEEQFSKLKDYCLDILDTNRDSIVVLDTVPSDGVGEVFHRFYVCFDVLRRTWRQYYQPIIGLDGYFLKCTTKGQLLAAVGRDSNNQMYPIAWAVVDVENIDNWFWFVEKLKIDLHLQDGDGFAIISDRQKGLINAVENLLPKAEHRMCARHIYGNLKKLHPHKPDMKGLFWKVAKSYNKAEYDTRVAAVKQYDIRVHDDMMEKNPKNCSRAYFKSIYCCDDVHNNISESFNNAIDPARAMPLVEMLETIRR